MLIPGKSYSRVSTCQPQRLDLDRVDLPVMVWSQSCSLIRSDDHSHCWICWFIVTPPIPAEVGITLTGNPQSLEGKRDRQAMGMEEATKRKHVLSQTLCICGIALPPADCRQSALHSATKTMHILWSMVYTYTHPLCAVHCAR